MDIKIKPKLYCFAGREKFDNIDKGTVYSTIIAFMYKDKLIDKQNVFERLERLRETLQEIGIPEDSIFFSLRSSEEYGFFGKKTDYAPGDMLSYVFMKIKGGELKRVIKSLEDSNFILRIGYWDIRFLERGEQKILLPKDTERGIFIVLPKKSIDYFDIIKFVNRISREGIDRGLILDKTIKIKLDKDIIDISKVDGTADMFIVFNTKDPKSAEKILRAITVSGFGQVYYIEIKEKLTLFKKIMLKYGDYWPKHVATIPKNFEIYAKE